MWRQSNESTSHPTTYTNGAKEWQSPPCYSHTEHGQEKLNNYWPPQGSWTNIIRINWSRPAWKKTVTKQIKHQNDTPVSQAVQGQHSELNGLYSHIHPMTRHLTSASEKQVEYRPYLGVKPVRQAKTKMRQSQPIHSWWWAVNNCNLIGVQCTRWWCEPPHYTVSESTDTWGGCKAGVWGNYITFGRIFLGDFLSFCQ